MSRTIRIAVAEPSDIIRAGIIAMLSAVSEFRLEVHEIADIAKLRDNLAWCKPDILIVNPALLGVFSLQKLRKESGQEDMKCVALQVSMVDPAVVRTYDAEVSIFDSGDQIREKIVRLVAEPRGESAREPLSAREKEVVVCVVQGLTNKQIADKLCLSTHTVITHRRNISAKLDIHSTAGLAIYAIVNKLIELSDVELRD